MWRGGDTTSVSLGSPVTVTELAEADPSATYRIKINGGLFTESNLTLGFGDGGVLTGFQSTVADHKVDFFVSLLKTAADVIGHVIQPAPVAVHAPGTAVTTAHQPASDCAGDLDEPERVALARLGKPHKAVACSLGAELRSAYLATPDRYLGFLDGYLHDNKPVDEHFMNALALFVELREVERSDASSLQPGTLPANSTLIQQF